VSAERERRYRRLLWAYPRAYRNGHGEEMVSTMLDLPEPGRLQMLHLVLCGVRQRFRLPARRPLTWVTALLAAVVLGSLGAAAGTWVGWQTSPSLPSDRELRALNAAMTGMPADAALYTEPLAMRGPNVLVRADGTADWSADRVRGALLAAGWHIRSFTVYEDFTVSSIGQQATIADVNQGPRIPTMNVGYTATKGSLRLDGFGTVVTGTQRPELVGQASYGTGVWPREPATVPALVIAGIIAGALTGWLLAAAFAYRARDRRRLATTLSTVGLAAATVPAFELYHDAYQVLLYRALGSPYPYLVYGPIDRTLALTCAVIGIAAVVAAAVLVARPRRAPALIAGQ
jgi:hypothetical protein